MVKKVPLSFTGAGEDQWGDGQHRVRHAGQQAELPGAAVGCGTHGGAQSGRQLESRARRTSARSRLQEDQRRGPGERRVAKRAY